MSNPNARGGYQSVLKVAGTLFLVATAVTMMQYKIPTIMLPVMQRFAIDLGTASWLMSIFTFVGIVCALPVGSAARRFGPKKLIMLAVALACVASVAGAFATDVRLLLLTRALEGMALVSVVACGPLVMQVTVDPARMGLANGIWMLGGMLGAMLGGVFTPLLHDNFGFAGLWIGYAIVAAVAGAVFFFAVEMPKPLENSGEKEFRRGLAEQYRPYFKASLVPFFLAFIIFQIMLLAVLSYSPTYLQQKGMDASMSGFLSTLPMLLAVLSSLGFGAVADKTQRVKPLLFVGVFAMAVTAPIMLAGDGAPLWVGAVAMGLLAMGVPTAVITAYPQVLGDPKLMTLGMGVLMLVQSIGQFLGSLVPSLLLGPAIANWTLCAAVLCALGLFGAACVALLKIK